MLRALRSPHGGKWSVRVDNAKDDRDSPLSAVDGARELLRTQPDSDPEIWDTTTGKPAAPAASKAWREDLARKVGF